MRSVQTTIAFSLVAIWLLAACGQAEPPVISTVATVVPPQNSVHLEGNKVALNVCSLLTQAEVEAAFGEPFLPPSPSPQGPPEECFYFSTRTSAFGDKNATAKAVIVKVVQIGAYNEILSERHNSLNQPFIEGLGNLAFDYAGVSGMLYAMQDRDTVMVFVSDMENVNTANLEARGLMKIVLARLSGLTEVF